ncbi:hypothetical protein EJ08DRAFT_140353 [Tothia fuscella]|uniref:Uncharacterized protein n=1 Tax=Tothia fuscella TaxID=1048955 RepID=A0A9P4NW66_9PEZI|nr:hypothetical protein EJ08DRAFT_140353 [Tothia fuscella]
MARSMARQHVSCNPWACASFLISFCDLAQLEYAHLHCTVISRAKAPFSGCNLVILLVRCSAFRPILSLLARKVYGPLMAPLGGFSYSRSQTKSIGEVLVLVIQLTVESPLNSRFAGRLNTNWPASGNDSFRSPTSGVVYPLSVWELGRELLPRESQLHFSGTHFA